jgi:hypothetical protein
VDVEELRAFVTAEHARFGVPGLAVAVAHEGILAIRRRGDNIVASTPAVGELVPMSSGVNRFSCLIAGFRSQRSGTSNRYSASVGRRRATDGVADSVHAQCIRRSGDAGR